MYVCVFSCTVKVLVLSLVNPTESMKVWVVFLPTQSEGRSDIVLVGGAFNCAFYFMYIHFRFIKTIYGHMVQSYINDSRVCMKA